MKNSNKIVCALLLLASVTNSNAMFRGRFTTESFKRGFNYLCTAAHWAIAAGPFWLNLAGPHNGEKEALQFPDAPPRIRDFFHKELAAGGIKNAKNVPIKVYPSFKKSTHYSTGVVNDSVLIVGNGRNDPSIEESELYRILKDREEITEEIKHKPESISKLEYNSMYLNAYRFIAQHEAQHIKNRDSTRKTCVNAITPLATHYGLKLFNLFKKTRPTTLVPTIASSLLKIPSGAGKAFISRTVEILYSQKREQAADDGVTNDKEILQGGIDYFEPLNEAMKHHYKTEVSKPTNTNQTPYVSYDEAEKTLFYKLLILTEDPQHPALQTRIDRLQERLKKLEEQELKNSKRANPTNQANGQ